MLNISELERGQKNVEMNKATSFYGVNVPKNTTRDLNDGFA